MAVTGVLTSSALLHLVVPFSRTLWALNFFLYAFWTPVWLWGLKLATLPISLPKRLRYTAALRAGSPLSKTVRGFERLPQRAQSLSAGVPAASESNDDDFDVHGLPALVFPSGASASDSSGSPPSSPGSSELPRLRARSKSAAAPEETSEDEWPLHPLLEKLLVPDGHHHRIVHKNGKAARKEAPKHRSSRNRDGGAGGGNHSFSNQSMSSGLKLLSPASVVTGVFGGVSGVARGVAYGLDFGLGVAVGGVASVAKTLRGGATRRD
jgi:hypothetical protein